VSALQVHPTPQRGDSQRTAAVLLQEMCAHLYCTQRRGETVTTNIVAILKQQSAWKRWTRRIVIGSLIAIVATFVLTVVTVSSQIGLGTMVSEKMLGRTGVTSSGLLLGHAGTNTTLSVLGFAPIVSTQTQTALGDSGGITTATLVGHVSNMNGLPSSTGYFEWGYGAALLINTTPTISITAVGDYSSVITGFSPTTEVYYRFVTEADGTAYGTVASFVIPSGVGGFLIKSILRLILAGIILVSVVKFGKTPMVMLVLAVLGIIGFAIISSLINTLF
jgi:hypothetical protein